MELKSKKRSSKPDYLAPDGSKIFLLPEVSRGGLCFCELPSLAVSKAVSHKTVEEIWYIISGEGELWRKYKSEEEIVILEKDMSITIPMGCYFQFRNVGNDPLTLIIATMPPWPGTNEVVPVEGFWKLPESSTDQIPSF